MSVEILATEPFLWKPPPVPPNGSSSSQPPKVPARCDLEAQAPLIYPAIQNHAPLPCWFKLALESDPEVAPDAGSRKGSRFQEPRNSGAGGLVIPTRLGGFQTRGGGITRNP